MDYSYAARGPRSGSSSNARAILDQMIVVTSVAARPPNTRSAKQSVQRTHAAMAEPPIHAKSECETVACWLYAEIMMPLPPMRVKWQSVIVARSCPAQS